MSVEKRLPGCALAAKTPAITIGGIIFHRFSLFLRTQKAIRSEVRAQQTRTLDYKTLYVNSFVGQRLYYYWNIITKY